MRARKNGDRPHFVRKRTFSNCGENIRKWGLPPFFLPITDLGMLPNEVSGTH